MVTLYILYPAMLPLSAFILIILGELSYSTVCCRSGVRVRGTCSCGCLECRTSPTRRRNRGAMMVSPACSTSLAISSSLSSVSSSSNTDTYTHVSRLPPEAGFKGAASPFGGVGSPHFSLFFLPPPAARKEKKGFSGTPRNPVRGLCPLHPC